MKTLLFIFSASLFSLSLNTADNCRTYLPHNEGTSWELTSYNAKGKKDGRTAYALNSVAAHDGGYDFKVNAKIYDKKDEEVMDMNYEASCKDGVFEMDMKPLMASFLSQYEDMDVTIDNSKLMYPKFDAPAGTEVEDSEISVTVDMGGMKMNTTFRYINRKLESRESITVPAGTFDCIVITSDQETKTMGMTIRTSSKEWYAESVGLVKNEHYNKNGKLTSYSELSVFTE